MFDFYRSINKHIVYPLYYWKNGDKRLARLAELETNQYLSKDDLEILQLTRLKNIIKYAYDNTEYYKKIMQDRDLTPADFKCIKDVEKLPLLTKSIIQENMQDMISKAYPFESLIKDSSGGSTGEPTIYYKDKDRHNLRRADQIRHDRWSGWDIGKRKALVWGAQRDLKAVQSFRENILATYLERQCELDAFEMSDKEMQSFTNQLENLQPSMILGYANALELYAKYLLKYHPCHKIKLDGIISSAETLTEEKRQTIESAFRCKVLNRYGSREVGLIASECKQQKGLHINADNLLLELVDNVGHAVNEGNGDIIVTDFWNFGMPIIRYKLGDVGKVSNIQCNCGRNLPLLGSVEGRSGDFFVKPDGSKIHGEYFTHLFYELPQVKQFQMIQESLEKIDLRIVETSKQKDQTYLEKIISKTKEMLGEQAEVNVEILDEIKPTTTGKLLFTISKLSN
ncbi:MAG: phenylacetate-CoA ligase [Polaribacter sp.]|jgi:phenylacetate-CoA ligase